jgi:hypothetical protein
MSEPAVKSAIDPDGAWLLRLWAGKGPWTPCPECWANAVKAEDVSHAAKCTFAARLERARKNGP